MSSELVFLWVGGDGPPYARIGFDEYLGRIRRLVPCRAVSVPQERHSGRYTAAHRVEREGKRLLERLDALANRPRIVALDPHGDAITSGQFARWLQDNALATGAAGVFVVGGPDGLSSSVRDRAHLQFGLSRLTLPHDMARLVLAEQVYRALMILRGHPYDR